MNNREIVASLTRSRLLSYMQLSLKSILEEMFLIQKFEAGEKGKGRIVF